MIGRGFVELPQSDLIHPTRFGTIDDRGLGFGQEACDIGSLSVVNKGDKRCSAISLRARGQPVGGRAREQDHNEGGLGEDKQSHGKSGPMCRTAWMQPEDLDKPCQEAMATSWRGATR